MGKLTVAGVRNAKPGRHADGDGLYLLVKPSGGRSWLLRVQVDGRRRDVGLGSVELAVRASDNTIEIPLLHRKRLSLSEAREKCALLRKAAEAGLDPILERDKDRRGVPTFEEAARACHAALKSNWAPRQQDAFMSSLRLHAFPLLGRRRVDHIEAKDVTEVLAPIWTKVPDAARKLRQRIGTVLNYAHSKGWRAAEAPKKSVTLGLSKGVRGGNYAAMPFADVPAYVSSLDALPETMGRMALLFTVLTAARSGEVRTARWSHVDLELKLWTRPGASMKMRKDHAVTLNEPAIALLERMAVLRVAEIDDPFVFPSTKNTALSDNTLSKILREAKVPYTVHGFRSSFRDWAAEKMPNIPDPVAEAALAHAVPDATERAYKRTSFIDMRRQLLDAWGDFLSRPKEIE